MIYANPIGIFNPQQQEQLNRISLPQLKADLLKDIQFPFTDPSGRSLNKEELTGIMDMLDHELEVHLEIFNNKPLYHFLVGQKLSYFKDFDSQLKVNLNNGLKNKINDHIADELNVVTFDLINNVDFNTTKKLQSILDYSNDMSIGQQNKSYQKAHQHLSTFVADLPRKFPHPFQHDEGKEIHSSLDGNIKPLLYKCFDHLPSFFTKIGNNYAIWCHNNVVNNAFRRVPSYFDIGTSGLRTISKAQEIGSHITTSDSFKEQAERVQQYLIENKTAEIKETSTIGGPLKIATIFLLIFGVFKMAVYITRFANMGDRSSQPTYTQKLNEYLKNNPQVNTKNTPKDIGIQICKDFVGDNPTLWNPVLTNTKKGSGYIELDYTVDVFPTNTDDLKSFVPDEMKEKEFEGVKGVVINLKDKDFPKIKMSYRLEAEWKANKRNIFISYPDEKKKMDRNDKVTTKRMLKDKYLTGSISRYLVKGKQLLEKKEFEIVTLGKDEAKAAKQAAKMEEGMNPTFAQEMALRWSGLKMNKIEAQTYKDVIMHNLNQVAFKSLVYRGYYAADNLVTYDPPNKGRESAPLKIDLVNKIKGDMLYFIKSNHDDTSITWVNGKDYKIRYFLDRESKQVVGMNMAVLSEDKKVVELIEVFFERR